MQASRSSAKTVVLGSMAIVMFYRRALVRALIVPVLLLLVLSAATRTQAYDYLWLPLAIVELGLVTIMAVTIHRIVLLGPASMPAWGLKRWSLRETYFAIHLLLVGIVVAVLTGGLSMSPLGLSGLVFASYLVARLSLVFPAAAVDEGVSFLTSWSWTRSHQLLMLVAVVFVPAAIYVCAAVIYLLVLRIGLPDLFLIEPLVDAVLTVVITSLLSLAYREISGFEGRSREGAGN